MSQSTLPTDLSAEDVDSPRSPELFELLLHRYRPLASSLAHRYYVSGADHDDLEQEALIGLFRALRDYRSELGIPFKGFATMCIRRALGDAVRQSLTQKNLPLRSYTSLSPKESGDDNPQLELSRASIASDPADIVVAADLVRRVQAVLLPQLSSCEQEVWMSYLAGHSYSEIADRVGCSLKTVDNAVQRVKRKLGACRKEFFSEQHREQPRLH